MTHIPKNPYCVGCLRAKLNARQARRRNHKSDANAFGDIVTADHLIAKDEDGDGIDNGKVALVIKDHYSKWIEAYPSGCKSTDTAAFAIGDFMGTNRRERIKRMYIDNATELLAAVSRLKIHHGTSTPYRSTTNSLAERNTVSYWKGPGPFWSMLDFPFNGGHMPSNASVSP